MENGWWPTTSFYSLNDAAVIGACSSFSSSTVASGIVSRLDTQDNFRLMNIGLIFEADFDGFLPFDFVVEELPFPVPLLDLSDILALDILLGGDVSYLLVLFVEHGDVAGDRAVPVALGVPKLKWRVFPFADDVSILSVHAGAEFV